MTDEQFEILSRFEKNLETARRASWAMNPGTPNLKRIHAVVDELNGKKTNVLYFCGSCVLRLLREAANFYFPEKEAREAKAKAAEKPVETAPATKKAATKPAKTAEKKTTTRKPKAKNLPS